jgi:malate dehydrogenase
MLSHRLADIVLVDVIEGMPQGKALDLAEAAPIEGVDIRITGTNSYDETAGSDVVVIVAGIARKPGMSREDLLATNAGIVRGVTEQVTRRSPNAHLIVVTNPLDAMVYLAYKVSGFPHERVMGQSGALDSTRFRTFIAHALGVSVQDVSAIVIGAHSDTHMVPLASLAAVGGVPLGRLYGVRDLYVGVPAVLGAGGVERLLDAPMDPGERAAFDAAVVSIRENVALLKL